MRSKIPPCPGNRFPESLTTQLLLICDSVRSPSVPNNTIITDPEKEKDRRKLDNFQQIFALKFFLNNKITTTKIFINNTFHFGFLNPQQVYFWHKYNAINSEVEYHRSSDHKNWLEERVLYSLIVYFIVFVGIFYSFKKKKYNNFNFFIILSIFYYTFMLGWMGNPRYFIPSLMLISIFFGEGASLIFRKFFKYKTYF